MHAADFMRRVYTRTLINPWVSLKMQTFLGLQLDTTKLSRGLPANAMFYHKTGWWNNYTHDTGIVDDGKIQYIISIFVPLKEEMANPRLKMLAEKVHQLMISPLNSGKRHPSLHRYPYRPRSTDADDSQR